ncbi:hypothetical protein BJP24_13425 [Aeromonas allosaccharophila]|uniref:hypothetical protein n=1 Tax=Aeromonas allosaccharophila TaxID=656 RepID=UPI0005B21B68|nr:hypothetical protein [Aeromonas allosaccharophila]OKP44099.1 hypothetical protein BJP24_13425 [Aeromonas allosaccharophila]
MKKSNDGFELIYIFVAIIMFFVGMFIGGAWLAGKSVLDIIEASGSLATAFTLVFLFYQHVQLKIRQDKQEKNQQDMWREQNETILFQKYQMHRAEFFNLVDAIETRYKGKFIFKNKYRLYRRLFPHNTFSNIIFDYECKTLGSDNPFLVFEEVVDNHSREAKVLVDTSILPDSNIDRINKAVYDLDLCTCKLLNLFELECIVTPSIGYVHDGEFVVMNGLAPFEFIDRLISIANEFRLFANMKPYHGSTHIGFYSPLSVARKVVSYYLSNGFREINSAELIDILFDLDDLVDSLRDSILFNAMVTIVKPLDFLDHMALENNFKSDSKKITYELRGRFDSFLGACKDDFEKQPLDKVRLIDFSLKLTRVNL